MEDPSKELSTNSSDSDDWTLVSPPHSSSSSSSPDREEIVFDEHERLYTKKGLDETRSETHSDKDDDGLTDIDLSGNSGANSQILASTEEEKLNGTISTELEMLKFQPIDTSNDEEQDDSSNDSRRSSLTQSELNDYVDLGKVELENNATDHLNQINRNISHHSETSTETNVEVVVAAAKILSQSQQTDAPSQANCLSLIKVKLDELSETATAVSSRRDIAGRLLSWLSCLSMKHWILIVLILASNVLLDTVNVTKKYQHNKRGKDGNSWHKYVQNSFYSTDSADSIHPSRYADLKLLHSELSQCIKRQNPNSFKYYMSEDRFKDMENPSVYKFSRDNINFKSYKGLVCYGQETQWRKRFDKLKYEYNLDLRKLMQEAKRRVTNEMLESFHPALQFKLILNQIEYLDFLESKRHKKQSEETIKYLKAENLQLLHKLNKPNETGYQRLMVNLELENSKLQRENHALKSNLIQKAGPIYIKQSNDLEKFERENIVLKQFHFHVAQEITKSLKLFNLHAIDASTIHDTQESLKYQLMLTRGYLRKLGDKISTVLLENESLKEELKEVYLVSSTSNQANLPSIHKVSNNNNIHQSSNFRNDNNNPNALTDDTCMRDLTNLKAKAKHLENENARLRSECSKNRAELERYNTERHLNKTSCQSNERYARNWKRLGPVLDTAIDKRTKSSSNSKQIPEKEESDIVDDFYSLLSNFGNQIESGLAKFVEIDQESLPVSGKQIKETGMYLKEVALDIAEKADKVIPNYIREAFRTVKHNYDNDEPSSYTSNNNNHIEAPLPPPEQYPDSTFTSDNAVNASLCGDESELSLSDLSTNTGCFEPETTIDTAMNQENSEVRSVGDVVIDDTFNMDSSIPNKEVKDIKWFFSRAKQRKQLRKVNRNDLSGLNSDWLLKRAKLREKLRKSSPTAKGKKMKILRKKSSGISEKFTRIKEVLGEQVQYYWYGQKN